MQSTGREGPVDAGRGDLDGGGPGDPLDAGPASHDAAMPSWVGKIVAPAQNEWPWMQSSATSSGIAAGSARSSSCASQHPLRRGVQDRADVLVAARWSSRSSARVELQHLPDLLLAASCGRGGRRRVRRRQRRVLVGRVPDAEPRMRDGSVEVIRSCSRLECPASGRAVDPCAPGDGGVDVDALALHRPSPLAGRAQPRVDVLVDAEVDQRQRHAERARCTGRRARTTTSSPGTRCSAAPRTGSCPSSSSMIGMTPMNARVVWPRTAAVTVPTKLEAMIASEVRQHLDQDDAVQRLAVGPRRLDEVAVAQRHRLRAQHARAPGPAGERRARRR